MWLTVKSKTWVLARGLSLPKPNYFILGRESPVDEPLAADNVADDDEEDDPDLAEAIRLSQLETMNIEDERRREKEELEEV